MAVAASDFSAFRFSTEDLPERERMAIWREEFGRRMVKAEFEPLASRFFHRTTFRNLAGLSLGFSSGGGFRAMRTRSLLDDSSDDLVLTINTEGTAHSTQLGREALAGPFDGVMMSCAEWGQFSVTEPARFILISVPRKPIAAMVKDPEAAAGRLLRKETESLRLLTTYVSTAENGFNLATPELRHVFATHVQDLVALVLGAMRDSAKLACGRGLRAARLAAIKAEVTANLSRLDLSSDVVAASQGISASYLRKLFAVEGMSFVDFVLEQRLLRAHRMLADPRFAERAISAVAFEVGFNDLSYFNRTFRRRFGETPSDVRERAPQ